ncbi:MAG: hypothetical protein FJX35_23030 [Alphaproteobacteria bacterium]|nr:hypothetical protein [Alphaproteobacteria bacterium]
MSLSLTLALMTLAGGALALSIRQERQPPEPMKPKLVPWVYVSMTLVVVLLVLAAHAVSELTGVPLRGRFAG